MCSEKGYGYRSYRDTSPSGAAGVARPASNFQPRNTGISPQVVLENISIIIHLICYNFLINWPEVVELCVGVQHYLPPAVLVAKQSACPTAQVCGSNRSSGGVSFRPVHGRRKQILSRHNGPSGQEYFTAEFSVYRCRTFAWRKCPALMNRRHIGSRIQSRQHELNIRSRKLYCGLPQQLPEGNADR